MIPLKFFIVEGSRTEISITHAKWGCKARRLICYRLYILQNSQNLTPNYIKLSYACYYLIAHTCHHMDTSHRLTGFTKNE